MILRQSFLDNNCVISRAILADQSLRTPEADIRWIEGKQSSREVYILLYQGVAVLLGICEIKREHQGCWVCLELVLDDAILALSFRNTAFEVIGVFNCTCCNNQGSALM